MGGSAVTREGDAMIELLEHQPMADGKEVLHLENVRWSR